jgi:RHS repeat-associated protein
MEGTGRFRAICGALGMFAAPVLSFAGQTTARGSGRDFGVASQLHSRTLLERRDPATRGGVGVADSGDPVTVNSNTADRQGDYFREELSVSNGSGPVWQAVTASDGTNSDAGAVLVPDDSVTPIYDADGNLTHDGVYNYSWDGENRLFTIETSSGAESTGVPYRRVENLYDYLGRRVMREEFDDDEATTPVSSTRYLYAGWRCLAEIDSSDALQRSYCWGAGADHSFHLGDSAGALLWVQDEVGDVSHLACSDRNGNVTALVSAATGDRTAAYTYGPFGELLEIEGSYASSNPIRYSSKHAEPVGDLYYYGYRFLKPDTGQWLSRDPITEDGGLNLYAFVVNRPMHFIDILGKNKMPIELIYEPNDGKHHPLSAYTGPNGETISSLPRTDGQRALNHSTGIVDRSGTSFRRIHANRETGEIVAFREHFQRSQGGGIQKFYHGYSVPFESLHQVEKNALIRGGFASAAGRNLKRGVGKLLGWPLFVGLSALSYDNARAAGLSVGDAAP